MMEHSVDEDISVKTEIWWDNVPSNKLVSEVEYDGIMFLVKHWC